MRDTTQYSKECDDYLERQKLILERGVREGDTIGTIPPDVATKHGYFFGPPTVRTCQYRNLPYVLISLTCSVGKEFPFWFVQSRGTTRYGLKCYLPNTRDEKGWRELFDLHPDAKIRVLRKMPKSCSAEVDIPTS